MSVPVAVLTFLSVACLATGSPSDNILIETAEREINAVKHILLERHTVTYKNTGSKPVQEVLICHLANQTPDRAFFEVVEGLSDDAPELLVEPASSEGLPPNVTCEAAVLEAPLVSGKSTTLETYAVLIHQLTPRPKEIEQGDPQRVVLQASQHILSPYDMESESLQVKLPSKAIESYTGVTPMAKSGATINFGPYTSVPPFAGGTLAVHYENNSPFLEALACAREVQISHWGNVYVEEWYTIKHTGAMQKGEWSRLKYQSDARRNGLAAVRELTAVLPRSASALYFRDPIGNVSTSSVRRLRDKLEVRLQPRYPLFGGWQVDFVFGYSLPLASVVSVAKGGVRKIELPFSSPIRDLLVQDLTVKVVLPEGSSAVAAQLPFAVEEALEKKYSYLDTVGRPVLVLHKADVVPDHNVPLVVTYRFSPIYLLQEPLLLVAAFFTFFSAIILYVRCEFKLLPADKTKLL